MNIRNISPAASRYAPSILHATSILPTALSAVVLALALCTSATTACAEPVTLRFEAEVHTVVEANDPGSVLPVGVGDVITGAFTFEPVSSMPLDNPLDYQQFIVNQAFAAQLTIDGNSFHTPLATSSLELEAENNVLLFDVPNAFRDVIMIGSSLVPSDVLAFPNLSQQTRFSISLGGNSSLLDSAGFPEDVSIWNSFDFSRNLSIQLIDETGAGLSVGASIGDFVVVPEPATATFVVIAVGLSPWLRRVASSRARRLCP